MMETCVTSTINNHLEIHNLSNDHQCGFKRGHSTELLLVKMTEDWRTALDQKLVVGISNSNIAGDIWLWIKDYLDER